MKKRTNRATAATNPSWPLEVPPVPPSIDPKWAWHYRTLTRLRARLAAQRSVREAEIAAPIEGHGAHPADSGTDEFDHEIALTLLQHEADAEAQVTQAIQRIEEGSFGRCLQSGVRIPAARLRALPWCRYAREVEAQWESLHPMGLRLPAAASLRGAPVKIPGTGDAVREGFDHEPKQPEEPKAGKISTETPLPGSEADSDKA